MELCDSSGLAGTLVLQVKASHQVVIAPYVLAHQVDLEYAVIFIFLLLLVPTDFGLGRVRHDINVFL